MEAIFVDEVHEYDYTYKDTDEGVVHLLFRSNGDQWSDHYKGEEIMSITDTGDGFLFNHSKPKKEMDYHYAFYLSIMLKKLSFNDHKVETTGVKKLL